MAENQSIIEIDVRDAAFKEFHSLFEKYQKELTALPGAWGRTEKAIKSSANPFVKMVAIIKDGNDELRKAKTLTDKFSIAAKSAGKVFGTIARSSYALAKNIKDITLNIAKWAALGLFSLAAGGFGLKELGESASRQRKEAGGLGVTTGQLESAKINFSRFGDVESMLAKIQEAQTDPKKAWTLQAAGLNQSQTAGKNPAEILKLLLPAMASTFAKAPKGSEQAYMEAHGLSQFGDIGTQNRLLSGKNSGELKSQVEQSKLDDKRLQVSKESLTAWQNFTSQMQRAGAMIENVFITHLSKLAGPVGRLSASFAKAVDTIFKSGTADKWIKQAAEGIDTFAKYLSGKEFPEDLKKFTSALETTARYVVAFGEAIMKVMDFLGLSPEDKDAKLAKFISSVPANAKSSIKLNGESVQVAKKSGTNSIIPRIGIMQKALQDTYPQKIGEEKNQPLPASSILKIIQGKNGQQGSNVNVNVNMITPAGGNQYETVNAAGRQA